jgi:hypothetical protein
MARWRQPSHAFLLDDLITQCAESPRTAKAYRDALRLLLGVP